MEYGHTKTERTLTAATSWAQVSERAPAMKAPAGPVLLTWKLN